MDDLRLEHHPDGSVTATLIPEPPVSEEEWERRRRAVKPESRLPFPEWHD